MPVGRYFADQPLIEGQEVILDAEEEHHRKVTRVRLGESVEVVNGRGQLGQGIATAQGIQITSVVTIPCTKELVLVQGLCRLNRLDIVLEKGTELGMTKLLLYPGERSERVEVSPNQQKRMRRIMIGAMKQCGRVDLPEVVMMPPLAEWDKFDLPSYFGDVNPDAPLLKTLWKPTQRVHFFVGPESGFSQNETAILKKQGVQGVRIHNNILRTETAPLVALSLFSHWML